MARPFPTTFEKDAQLGNQSGGTTPISYQANVNRQKTKKWVDAKTANYGGDDWGDDDDEYDDYNDPPPPPPPATNPAGYRQPGSNIQSPSQGQPPSATYKKSYGELPSRPRANSFDDDDEIRNFSSATAVPPPAAQVNTSAPPTRFSQITAAPSSRQDVGPPLSVQTQQPSYPPPQEQRQPSRALSPGESTQSQRIGSGNVPPPTDSRFSSGDYQAKRDYSPTAAPPPLNTFSPTANSESPGARFPARKSSLSSTTGPPSLQEINRPQQATQPPPSVTSPSKALPFIRPADIYRRAEEERRQSLESGGRPNVDAIMNSRPGDRSDSPGRPRLAEKLSADSLGGRQRQGADRDESPAGRYLAPALEPVKERKSEYGFDGFNVNDHATKSAALDQPSQPSESSKLDAQDARTLNTSPKLPDLNRMSGFGMDMFLPSSTTQSQSTQPPPAQLPNVESPTTPVATRGIPSSTTHAGGFESGPPPSFEESHNSSKEPTLHGRDNSTVYHSIDDDEQLQPPRSLAHAPSEQSFRPNLPGGWTSYATTAQPETPQPDSQGSSIRRQEADIDDIAPTTIKHALPQTESKVDVADFESGAPRGEHDAERMLPPPPPKQHDFSGDAMPTPDPSMAPSGNLYSTTTVDPRLLPKLEQAPPETQLRPDVVDSGPTSSALGTPPPPPAKDTPLLRQSIEPDGYFPADPQAQDAPQKTESSHQNWRAHTPEELSKDENDRLEEEIVSRLSPQPREEPGNGNLMTPGNDNAARESTYLPSEYGDYWASGSPDVKTPPLQVGHDSYNGPNASVPASTIRRVDSQSETVAPLSVSKPDSQADSEGPERPSVQQRFSWEQSSENVSKVDLAREQDVNSYPPPPALPATYASTPDSPETTQAGAQTSYDSIPSPQYDLLPPPPAVDEKIATNPESASITRGSFEGQHESNTGAIVGGTAALAAGVTAAAVTMNNAQPQRRASLAEEKSTRVSEYPVNITPPENEHPARSPEPYFGNSQDPTSTSDGVSAVNSPIIPPPPATTSRLLAFKEIMNMKTSHQRIQTFDETRHRFAAMDSGLSSWMTTLQAQHPEHNNATGSWTGGIPAKNAKAGAPGLQQPYYQQYLNASSPTNPSTPSAAAGGSGPTGSQQGFSSGPSKITTQQVQAKGKELLHTAGIFGGKAGKAGKGLLAKGKSRFRGSGGDKISPEPTPKELKPKNESRMSWGLSSSKSRNAGVSEASTPSKDNLSAPRLVDDAQRTPTITSISSQPPVLPRTATSGTFDNIDVPGAWPATPAVASTSTPAGNQVEAVSSVREIKDADQSTTESDVREDLEERDRVDNDLAPPRPIGKHQPSWDPFNATPIAEEQGSAYDTRPEQKAYPFPAATLVNEAEKLSVASPIAHVGHSVQETGPIEQRDSVKDDWVIVPPHEANDVEKGQINPAGIMHRGRGDSFDNTNRTATRSKNNSPQKSLRGSIASRKDREHSAEPQSPAVGNEQEGSQRDSTFLPPIRRTSAFGFKFGSRHSKQRFPIDDDDEDFVVGNAQGDAENDASKIGAGATVGPTSHEVRQDDHHAPLRHERRSLQQLRQEDSGYSTDQPVLQSNDPTILGTSAPLRSVFPTDPDRRQSLDERSRRGSNETARPPLIQASSSEYSQRSMASHGSDTVQRSDSSSHLNASRTSQDAWRPNFVSTGISSPPPQDVPAPGFAARQSWDGGRPRGASGSGQSFTSRPDVPVNERPWAPGPARPFDQPPSAAQRYPGLFKSSVAPVPDNTNVDHDDMPAHYYQQPLPREAAFLPRQSTNEYQLPGVGPDEYRKTPRRNSSLLRELGGRLSRATSRERRNSVSRDDDYGISRPRNDSRVDDDADSSIVSEEVADKKRRRSSFFLGLGRSSTGISDAPKSRENITAQPSGSRADLANTPNEPSPLAPQKPAGLEEKKKSFFGSGSSEQKSKANKLSRGSISSVPEPSPTATPTKKKRFSGLTGFFAAKPASREGTPDRPQATRQLSSNERQPLESPQLSRFPTLLQGPNREYTPPQQQYQQGPPVHPQGPPQQNVQDPNKVQGSQNVAKQGSRNFLSKAQNGVSQQDGQRSFSQPVQQESQPRKASRTRRSSGAGLFSGFLGRKQSSQDDGRSDQAPISQPQYSGPPRTYSGVDDSQFTGRQVSQEPGSSQSPFQERGRQVSREPAYDSVPIPGGYSLVRAQAGQPAPTEYDPRGTRFQQPGRFSQDYQSQSPIHGQSQFPQAYGQSQESNSPRSTPTLGVETQPRSNQNFSHIASQDAQYVNRNVPKHLQDNNSTRSPVDAGDQQTPYQLSLPGDITDPVNANCTPTSPHSDRIGSHLPTVLAHQAGQNASISRLQPQIRQPDSPASRALPEDTVFSPVVQGVDDLPPPPPPKDGGNQTLAPDHSRQPSGSSYLTSFDLNRSGTHRTAVSVVSGLSDSQVGSSGVDAVTPRRASLDRSALDSVAIPPRDPRHVLPTSPTPPSPITTLSRGGSPALSHSNENAGNVKTTVLEAPRRQSLDLYDASPLVPQAPRASGQTAPGNRSRPETPRLSIHTGAPSPGFPAGQNQPQQQTGSNPRPNAMSEQGRSLSELEGTKADGFNMRIPSQQQHSGEVEEKIFYDSQSGMRGAPYGKEEEGVSMSATSYPGQEWNPYGNGAWDDSDEGEGKKR